MRNIYKIGDKVGKLEIIKLYRKDTNGLNIWLCRCECGNERIVRSNILRQRKFNACKECTPIYNRKYPKDLTGLRFGRLVVKEKLNKRHNTHVVWKCLCDCNNEIEVPSINLNVGDTKSCGCIGKDRMHILGSSKKLPNKQGLINRLYSNYRRTAKYRNFEFKLSKEDFKILISGSCYYCNILPEQIYKVKNHPDVLYYNGIDRKDNKEGYFIENCVSCCYICNKMKSAYSYDFFINHIEKIYTTLKEKEK